MEANGMQASRLEGKGCRVRAPQTQHRLPGDLPHGLEASVVGPVGPWAQKALPLIYLQLGL